MHGVALKLNPVFLLADGESSWSLLQSLVSLVSWGKHQKTPIPVSPRWHARSVKAQKG